MMNNETPFRGKISLPINGSELRIVVGDEQDVVFFMGKKITINKQIIHGDNEGVEFCQCGDEEGEVIVLLPPGGVEFFSMYCIVPYLIANGFRVIGVNGRGVAGSYGGLEGLTLHHMAADVAKVLCQIDASPVHVVGNALGNRVARCLAQDYPELVRTVTLVAAGGKIAPEPNVIKAMASLSLLGSEDINKEEARDVIKRTFLSHASNSIEESPIGRLLLHYYNHHPNATVAHLKAGETSAAEWWTSGKAPLLVIQGEDDQIAPPGNGEVLKKELKDRVTLVNIRGAGHGLLQERSREISNIITDYIVCV